MTDLKCLVDGREKTVSLPGEDFVVKFPLVPSVFAIGPCLHEESTDAEINNSYIKISKGIRYQ